MAAYEKHRSPLQMPGLLSEVDHLNGVTGLRRLSDRLEFLWIGGQRGKPGLNADIQNAAENVRMIADPDFELLGTNAVSSCSAFGAEGGITLTTTTTSGDQVILVPHLDANQSAWAQVTWGTDQETAWFADIKTPATITTMTIWAGLKLTNTSTTATDDDQCFFRFQPSVNSGKLQAISSIGGTDSATDTGITVAASTRYRFGVVIDSGRQASFWARVGAEDPILIKRTAALTNAVDLIPYIGVETGAAAARAVTVYQQAISRKFA